MHDLLVFIPLTVLIVSALVTKKMAESMICATLVAMAMLHKGNFLSGTIDSFYATLSNDSFQFVVLILVTFGGVIQLLQKSGALTGFGNLLARFATTPKRSMLLAWRILTSRAYRRFLKASRGVVCTVLWLAFSLFI